MQATLRMWDMSAAVKADSKAAKGKGAGTKGSSLLEMLAKAKTTAAVSEKGAYDGGGI